MGKGKEGGRVAGEGGEEGREGKGGEVVPKCHNSDLASLLLLLGLGFRVRVRNR